MEHYRREFECGVCERKLVADITSIGTPHQTIIAITCRECGEKTGGTFLGVK